jgi:hypothetical protein
MRVALPFWFWLFFLASTGSAQDWAKAMFDHTRHDFGVVGRGASLEHRFKLKNIYVEDVRISSVGTTCGCTTPKTTKELLKTYETAEIVAGIDTRKFLGQKDATIKVKFSQPFPAEVDLRVASFIRSDVVVEPGSVRFGSVSHGSAAQAKVAVSYAGREDWKITDVQSANLHLEAKLTETGRSLGQVSYDVLVTLKPSAPVGPLKDQLVLATNDRNAQTARILLPVEGIVVAADSGVTAGPSPFSVGAVTAGQTVSKSLIVRGKAPLRILDVAGPDERFRFQRPDGAKPVQIVPVTFVPGDKPGIVSGKIRIRTDVPGSENLEVPVEGQVLERGASPAPNKPGDKPPATAPDQKSPPPAAAK